MKKRVTDALSRLTPSDFGKFCMLYPRFKAPTVKEFVEKIGEDDRSLIGVLKLAEKQLESY